MRAQGLADSRTLTRQSKKRARELLDTGHNRLWLIFSICLWILSAGAIYLLCAGLVYAADDSIFTDQPSMLAMGLTMLAYGLMLLFVLILLVPMAGGTVLLARHVYEGRALETADLFVAFDSPGRYFRCMLIGVYGLAHPLLTVAIALLGCVAVPTVLYDAMMESGAISVLSGLASAGAFLIGVALVLLMLFTCRTAHLTCALMARDLTWREARKRTREILAKHRRTWLGYRLGFAGHLALAVATVGVSAVIDGIPHMLLCHQYACDFTNTQEK